MQIKQELRYVLGKHRRDQGDAASAVAVFFLPDNTGWVGPSFVSGQFPMQLINCIEHGIGIQGEEPTIQANSWGPGTWEIKGIEDIQEAYL